MSVRKEVTKIEVESGGILLEAEKICEYFIRAPSWDAPILTEVELEDIKTVAQLLMVIYKEFKELEKFKNDDFAYQVDGTMGPEDR